MHLIRTLAELPPDPDLQTILEPYAAATEEFGDDLSIAILIASAGDTLADVEHAYGQRLVANSKFTFPVESISEHADWYEAVWVQSDDGSGLVLLINKAGDASLVAACRTALVDSGWLP